jgi:hypothetical protein
MLKDKSQTGNKNALKWDEKTLTELLKKALHFVKNTPGVILKEEIGEELNFSSSLWKKWQDDYSNNSEITTLFGSIEQILKRRIIKPAIKNVYSANFSKFYLANAYSEEYADKKEVDVKGVNSLFGVIKELEKNDK